MEIQYTAFQFNPTISNPIYFHKAINGENYLYDLYSSQFKLNQALPISIEYKDGEYIAVEKKTGIWVNANTLNDAEQGLSEELLNLYNKLSLSNNLSRFASNCLAYLQARIQPINES